jgi:hypothetical protein
MRVDFLNIGGWSEIFMNLERLPHHAPVHSRGLDLLTSSAFRLSVLAILSYAVLAQAGALCASMPIYPVNRLSRGYDFAGFFGAVEKTLAHYPLDMYGRFYKPPFFALLVSLLVPFGLSAATWIFQIVLMAMTAMTVFWVCRASQCGFWTGILLFLCIVLSFPFHFLLDRGNVDAISLGLALYAAYCQMKRRPMRAALCIALALNIKTNILLLLPILIVDKSPREMARRFVACLTFLALFALLTPVHTQRWLFVMKSRAGWRTVYGENGSLYRALLGVPFGDQIASALLILFILLIIGGVIFRVMRDKVLSPVELMLLAMPLCQAFPRCSYLYGYLFLPLLLLIYPACLERPGIGIFARLAAVAGCLGVVLSCFPCVLVCTAFRVIWPWGIPSFGLLLILLANSILIWSMEVPIGALNSTQQESPDSELSVPASEAGVLPFVLILTGGAIYGVLQNSFFDRTRLLWLPPSFHSSVGVPLQNSGVRIRQFTRGPIDIALDCSGLKCSRLSIAGVKYKRGIGTRVPIETELKLPTGSAVLRGKCGVDDAQGPWGVASQCVIQSSKGELFRSPFLRKGEKPVSFDVDVSGEESVLLVGRSANDDGRLRLLDWVELSVIAGP